MTERTKLLKKAVLTSVGATTSVDRIKSALNEAIEDLAKVGQDLLSELEREGKSQTESVQDYIKRFQHEAGKRTNAMEKKVSSKVQTQIRKTAREFGLATREEVEEIMERLQELEETVGVHGNHSGHSGGGSRRGRKKRSS
jgi:polyhydroxyalkanoate synthesis regulator phasin